MATHEERLSAVEARFQRHDILINGKMGIIESLQALQKSVDELKQFQVKVLTIFGIAAVGVQVVIQLILKK
jgi:hypothetical protein